MSVSPSSDLAPRPLASPIDLEPLPVAYAPLTARKLEVVDAFLATWNRETGFGTTTHAHVARAYAKHCSPPDASTAGIQLATEYLGWFLCLNDLPTGDAKRRALVEARAVLREGAAPFTAEGRATRAFRDRLERCVDAGRLSAFYEAIWRLLDAFERELGLLAQIRATVPPVEDYLRLREQTIAHYPYLELWKATERFEVPHRAAEAVAKLERSNVRIVFIVNDLLSVHRDRRTGKLNLVVAVRNERGLETSASIAFVRQLLDRETTSYLEASASLKNEASPTGLATYLTFLDSVLEGNRIATLELSDRFRGGA